MAFTPWRERTAPESGPFDGVPDHLERPLREWIGQNLSHATATRIALTLRMALASAVRPAAALMHEIAGDEDLTLTVVDLMLRDAAEHLRESMDQVSVYEVQNLEVMLVRGGSLWSVSDSRDGLMRRVMPEYQAIFDQTASSASSAAECLRTAWASCYGLNPNPNHSFNESVRAVEYAAGSVVTPKAERFQLNKLAGSLRDQKVKFGAVLSTEAGTEPHPIDVVVTMMQWLIRAQSARHGAPGDATMEHTGAEAEMALQLAVQLVHWFEQGYVYRVDQ